MISFAPLWKTMESKGITQYALINKYGFSTGTLDALRKNKSVTLNTIQDLCNILECPIEDIVSISIDKN
jgi:DNA-binding Xre family transcriptional regulator